MAESATITIRLPAKTKAKLEKLAQLSRRTKSWHAAEALEAYVAYQMPIVEKIAQGLASARAGRLIPHADVMREAEAVIAKAERAHQRRMKA